MPVTMGLDSTLAVLYGVDVRLNLLIFTESRWKVPIWPSNKISLTAVLANNCCSGAILARSMAHAAAIFSHSFSFLSRRFLANDINSWASSFLEVHFHAVNK